MIPERSNTSNERIRELIDDLGMSQIEFCNRTGIKASALSNYLNGNRVPRQDAIMKIADTFNISASWLMGYDVPVKADDRTVIGQHLDGTNYLRVLEIYSKPERLKMYADLLSAADGCDPEQITPIVEALKAMAKANIKNHDDN